MQVKLLEQQVEERMQSFACTDREGNITDLQVRRTRHHIASLRKHVLADRADAERVRDNEGTCLWSAVDGFIR